MTAYPIDEGVYDWALFNDFFNVKKQAQMEPNFIQQFTSASQEHYHYENGTSSSLRNSGTPKPPYFFFQLKNVACETPICRHISSTRVPVSD